MRKWTFVLMGAIISLGYVGTAKADKAFLKALQDTLAKLGNPWVAGETELSNLPIEEKRKRCGFIPVPEGEWKPDLEQAKIPSTKKAPPASWDWREKEGKDWTTPVKDQYPCWNCWAFAMCSAMEAMLKIQNNTPDENPNLSEQFLTSCNTKNKKCYTGGNFTVFEDVQNFGVCNEACFPYAGDDSPCNNRCPAWEDSVVKIEDYRFNFFWDAPALEMKEWIMEGPIACAITVKEDIFYYKEGVYEPLLGEKLSNHAVCCIGWTSGNKWICKNSWGPSSQPWITTGVLEKPCWIKMVVDTTGVTEEKKTAALTTFKLSPNPFRDKVNISYFVSEKTYVKLVTCDIAGREIARIVDGLENTGIKKIEWDTKNIPSGVYFCHLTTGNSETTRKILLVR